MHIPAHTGPAASHEAPEGRARQAYDAVCAALRPVRKGGPTSFVADPVPVQWGVPFGGLLAAQALAAATATTELWPRSIHAYFVGVGKDDEAVEIDVTEVAGTRSTAWRSVDVRQGQRLLLHAEAMFSGDRAGPEHTRAMPPTPPPEALVNVGADLAPYPDTFTPWGAHSAFDLRYVDPAPRIEAALGGPGEPRSRVWLRAAGDDPGDPRLSAALLAYASDMCMLDACLRPVGLWFGEGSATGLTLDHSMWFHAPARMDDWLLLDLHSPAMRGGRGLGVSDVYARDGEMLCTVAQLGSIRPMQA